jgi:hypothetical protein
MTHTHSRHPIQTGIYAVGGRAGAAKMPPAPARARSSLVLPPSAQEDTCAYIRNAFGAPNSRRAPLGTLLGMASLSRDPCLVPLSRSLLDRSHSLPHLLSTDSLRLDPPVVVTSPS